MPDGHKECSLGQKESQHGGREYFGKIPPLHPLSGQKEREEPEEQSSPYSPETE